MMPMNTCAGLNPSVGGTENRGEIVKEDLMGKIKEMQKAISALTTDSFTLTLTLVLEP